MGFQFVIRKNVILIKLRSIDIINIEAGEGLVIKTPDGGGFGKYYEK